MSHAAAVPRGVVSYSEVPPNTQVIAGLYTQCSCLTPSRRPWVRRRLSQLESTLACLVHKPLLLQTRKLQRRGKSLNQAHLARQDQSQDSGLVSWLQVSFSSLLLLNRLPDHGVVLCGVCLFRGPGIQAGLGWAVLLLHVLLLRGSVIWLHLAVAGLGWKVLEGLTPMADPTCGGSLHGVAWMSSEHGGPFIWQLAFRRGCSKQ